MGPSRPNDIYTMPKMIPRVIQYLKSILFLILLLLAPSLSLAQPSVSDNSGSNLEIKEQYFKAKVTAVLDEQTASDYSGVETVLQKLELVGIDKDFQEKIIYDGITTASTTKHQYTVGDKVIVMITSSDQGETIQITDSIRTTPLIIYTLIFVILVIIVARVKGLKSLLSLGLSIAIVIGVIIPLIIKGYNPLWITVLFALPILALTIYLTHGINRQSHIALAGTFFGVLAVALISLIFASIGKLTGYADDEVIYITSLLSYNLNPYNLLLAGFIIGALGIVDDVALTQVAVVTEIKKANTKLTNLEVYNQSIKVGVSHIASIINTLFMAYAGASFSLLLLFSYRQPPFQNIFMVFNNEIVATEIVRTIVGSIGIILVIPLTTVLATKFIHASNYNK